MKSQVSKVIFKKIIVVCIYIFSTATLLGCKQEKPLQLILCIGQSNMAGRAEIPIEDTGTLKNVFLLNDQDEWEPAKNPLNRYSSIRKEIGMQGLGPAWTFSKRLSEIYPEKKFGLVVNVRGGTSIDSWKKGSHYYNEAVIKALKAQRKGAELIGVIWHQGEGDRIKSEGYSDKFYDMVTHFRADLGIPDLPFVIGEIGNWKGDSKSINQEIASIPRKVPFVACVNVEGLTHKGDTLHFSADAQHKLGRRYAEKFMEVVQIN